MITLQPKFVESLPKEFEEGILYISMRYKAVGHKCPCGCGNLVFTPLSPVDWQLYYDGKVTIEPSIGNWDFECKSHYWIIKNEVHFARKWGEWKIERARKKDAKNKKRYFKRRSKKNNNSKS